ncbi:hypothetical protein V8E36_008318 [Tilletia maclaganii]
MVPPPAKRSKIVHFVTRRYGSGSSSGSSTGRAAATGPAAGGTSSIRGSASTATGGTRGSAGGTRGSAVASRAAGHDDDDSDSADLFIPSDIDEADIDAEEWQDDPEDDAEPVAVSKKGKGKAKEVQSGGASRSKKGKGTGKDHSSVEAIPAPRRGNQAAPEAPPERLSKEALAVALREINPAISLQATQVTAWSSIEAQHSLVELGIEQARLLRVIATALALGLGSDGGGEAAQAESDRLLVRIQAIPQARIPAFFSKGPSWNWRLVGSPWVALSTIASTVSWIRTSLTPNWLAGSRTSEQWKAVKEPVTEDRLPTGFWNIGDVNEAADDDGGANDAGDEDLSMTLV